MDLPNDSVDSATVSEFIRTGNLPECVVFSVIDSPHSATMMVNYLRHVWLDRGDFVWNLRLRKLADGLRARI